MINLYKENQEYSRKSKGRKLIEAQASHQEGEVRFYREEEVTKNMIDVFKDK